MAIAILATAQFGCDRGPKFGAPDHVAKQGDGQVADAGTPVTNPAGVTVLDADGRGVPGIAVSFAVTSGGGSLQNTTATTDKSGTASAGVWTLGTLAGTQTIAASSPNVPGFPVSLTATAKPGAMAALVKVGNEPVSSPATGNVDSIVVRAIDQFGNSVPNQTVNFAVTAGGGSVSPASRTTQADGRAAARWTLGSEIGVTNTALASRPDGSLAVSFATLSTRPVANVRFIDRVLIVDSASSITPSISLVDASGDEVPGAVAAMTVRNVSVASGGSSLTGLRSGQTFVVATSLDNNAARDSALLVIAGAGKPAVTINVPRFDLKADTTFTISIVLDSRSASTPVGSATLQVVWNTSVLSFVSETAGAVGNAVIAVNSAAAASGSLTIGMASVAGITGAGELRRITFKASATAGRAGTLAVNVADVAAAGTFANLTGQTVSGSYALRTR